MEGDLEAKWGEVTAKIYHKVLKKYLLRVLSKNSIFMYNNTHIHSAKIIKEFLKEESIEIITLLPYLPNLNLIKNL